MKIFTYLIFFRNVHDFIFFCSYVIEEIHGRSLTSENFGKNAARALRNVQSSKQEKIWQCLCDKAQYDD